MKVTLRKSKLQYPASISIQEKDAGEEVSAGFRIVNIIR